MKDIQYDLTKPRNVNPVIDRAKPKEITGILSQTTESR